MAKIKNAIKLARGEMNREHQGAVAFEYVIILVIMAVAIFAAWGMMGDMIIDKAEDIANFIGKNGQGGLDDSGFTRGNTVKDSYWGH